jgi:serine/threonine protein kinase
VCREHGFVALKVVPEDTGMNNEGRILRYLARQKQRRHSPQRDGSEGGSNVLQLLDHIPITTGKAYCCLVLEVVGSDIYTQLKNRGGRGLCCAEAKRASVEVARGLAYLHRLGICHGGY